MCLDKHARGATPSEPQPPQPKQPPPPPPQPPDVSSQVLLSWSLHGDSRGHHGMQWRSHWTRRRRRWERRLRAALRHEQQTVAMVLSAALHHSAQVGADVLYAARRSQKTDRTAGRRPGVLKEPVPPVVVEHAACPCSGAPLLVVPSLAAAESDGVDGTSLKYLLKLALQMKGEEEKEKEEKRKRKEVLARARERVRDGLPLSSAEDAAWRQWSGLPPRQEKRRKGKKRKKRRLLRTSSRPSRCRKLWRFRSCSFSTLSSSSPVVPQRQILMVQTIQQITEFSQLLYVSGGRCPCCAGRACHAVSTALICTWLVFLVTLHLALCSCVSVWPTMLRIMAGTHHAVAGFTGDDAPRAGMTQKDSCLEEYRKIWSLWEMMSYVSVFISLVRQWMHIYVSLQRLGLRLQKTAECRIAGHRHLFRAEEADPHGPDFSTDHRGSTVAVRIWLSISQLCGPCSLPFEIHIL